MAALAEERRVKQHEELEVLRSIFADDIVSVKLQNCWKVKKRSVQECLP
jgi:hypothetical protein